MLGHFRVGVQWGKARKTLATLYKQAVDSSEVVERVTWSVGRSHHSEGPVTGPRVEPEARGPV